MERKRLLCVDCYETLERVSSPSLNIFFCNNIKCRRFGVLTIGGLFGERCEKGLMLDNERIIKKKES